jgi:serine protease Do
VPELPEKETESTVARTIEDILKGLKGYPLASMAATVEVKEGGAKIRISYNNENYFVSADAFLCQLPKEATRIKPLYQFLLTENYQITGLVLSCIQQNIVLSSLIYDLDLNKESGTETLRRLFKKPTNMMNFSKKNSGALQFRGGRWQ